MRKRLEAPLNKLENATVHLETDVQEKFSKSCSGSREQERVKGLLRVMKLVSENWGSR